MANSLNIHLPAEWAEQDAILMAWPHQNTDWNYMLDEVQQCYRNIIEAITDHEDLILVTPEPEITAAQLAHITNQQRIHIFKVDTNDTWARDFGAITIYNNGTLSPIDFKFNGWGLKFAACKDNLINSELMNQGLFSSPLINRLNFALEGGSIESDGNGTIMTTSNCLLSPNRNGEFSKTQIEQHLIQYFNAKQILWVDFGDLEGDDTDSHIDTLARFIPNHGLVFTECDDINDSHYSELKKMADQIKSFHNAELQPYKFIKLPLPDAIFDEEGHRLPATYANFLITNNSVLVPIYNQPEKDKIALNALKAAMPQYNVIGIDCRALIKQHGSLHCVTMQFPKGSIRL